MVQVIAWKVLWMFKKIKRNVVLLNMIIISSVMVLSFTTIFLIIKSNTLNSLQEDLNRISFNQDNPVYYDDYAFEAILPSDYQLSFQLSYNHRLDLMSIHSFIDMPISWYQEAGKLVLKNNKDRGQIKLGNKIWMYKAEPSGTLNVAFLDVSDSLSNLNKLKLAFISVGSIMLAVIFFISIYFAKRSIKPIEEAWKMQKEFISNASHELKTPLAIINVNADALALQDHNQWIENIQLEIKNMNSLVTDLLDLSKSENKHIELNTINLSELIHKNLSLFEVMVYEKGINMSLSVKENVMVKSDKEKLNQMIRIFLDNALKYSDKEIDISVTESSRYISLEFRNDGETLTPDQMKHVFDRFYKTDAARSRHLSSYGLGLPIVKALSDTLGHEISVKSDDKYTTFKLLFKI